MSLNLNQSDSNIPLHQRPSAQYPFGREFQYGSGQSQQLYAPRPQKANQYGYLKDDDLASDESGSTEHGGPRRGYPQPRQSTEEVAWDTGRHEQPQSNYGIQPRRTTSPENFNPPNQRLNQIQQQPPPPAPQLNFQPQPLSPVNTPKQPSTANTIVSSPPLPTPSYPATFAQQQQTPVSSAAYHTSPTSQPQQYHHEPEPTGLSYHTADGSEASVSGGLEYTPNPYSNPYYNQQQQQQRLHSPPPPSYRTDAYGHPMR